MKNQFHHTVNDLKSQPLLAITHALRCLDAGFDALAQSVRTKISAPTLILTQAEHFKTLIPQCMHDCPAFVLWLPTTFTGDILDLAHVEPIVYGRSAPDLKKRDLMMSWGHFDFTFATFASPLLPSIQAQHDNGDIAMIFATDILTVVSVLPISSDFLDSVNSLASQCGEHYQPTKLFSDEWLKGASKRRRDPDEFELDTAGRRIVLLQPRRVSRPDRIA